MDVRALHLTEGTEEMTPLTRAIPIAFLVTASHAAPECAPPDAALKKLRAELTFENGLGSNGTRVRTFTMLSVGNTVFLRHDNPGRRSDPSLWAVEVWRGSQSIDGINCPSTDEEFRKCVARWIIRDQSGKKDEGSLFTKPPEPATDINPAEGPACTFTLEVSEWQPSPDSPQKRNRAAAVRQEVLTRLAPAKPKVVYIRDFNLDDPDIHVYIEHKDGEREVQGCGFDSSKAPHCVWHGFGTVTLESVRDEILAKPYKLYP